MPELEGVVDAPPDLASQTDALVRCPALTCVEQVFVGRVARDGRGFDDPGEEVPDLVLIRDGLCNRPDHQVVLHEVGPDLRLRIPFQRPFAGPRRCPEEQCHVHRLGWCHAIAEGVPQGLLVPLEDLRVKVREAVGRRQLLCCEVSLDRCSFGVLCVDAKSVDCLPPR